MRKWKTTQFVHGKEKKELSRHLRHGKETLVFAKGLKMSHAGRKYCIFLNFKKQINKTDEKCFK